MELGGDEDGGEGRDGRGVGSEGVLFCDGVLGR